MIRIVHMADAHLDSKYEALTEAAALKRRQENRENLQAVADYANRIEADLLLVAGDLLESADMAAETAEAIKKAFSSFKGKVLLIFGNHDYALRQHPQLRFEDLPNVITFEKTSIQKVTFPEWNLTVYGASFDSPYREESTLENFRVEDESKINIMLLHGELRQGKGLYNPITEKQIADTGLTYLALGHTHSFSGLLKSGRTSYAFPGCLSGRGFDETGTKGFLAGTISKDEAALEFVPIDRPQYHDKEVDITDFTYPMLIAKIRELAKNSALAGGIVRLRLSGERVFETLDAQQLAADLGSLFYSLSIKDGSFPKRNLWAGLQKDTLEGVFLQKMRAAYDATDSEEEKNTLLLAVRFGLSAMEGRDNPL